MKEIFEFWKLTFKKNARTIFDRKRKSKVQARLKEKYTVDEIKQGIVGCSKSTYHVENGYTDLELICRDAVHLDRFIALGEKASTSQVADDWQNDKWTYAMLMDIQEATGGEMYHDREMYEKAKARFLSEHPVQDEVDEYERSQRFKQRFEVKK